ncbi:MAG: chemotaxis protein CheB [Archangium sp.]|nr:chemotaxis protein CheB [Archangium sp.]
MKHPGLIRALIVDDSRTARLSLRAVLESESGLCVVGEAETGDEALRLVQRLAPDIVLMDVYLKDQNGLDVAGELMSTHPCPILAVTAANPSDPALVFRGTDVGVLEIALKPPAPDHPGYDAARRQLVRLVRVLSQVPVVHRFAHRRTHAPTMTPPPTVKPLPTVPGAVLLGASTGGPQALCAVLERVPAPHPLPIIVVQHMTKGFGPAFATWLQDMTRHKVVLVERPETLAAGVVYLAADDRHLVFTSSQTLAPDDGPVVRYQRPSADLLFESAARLFRGPMLGAVLSGMGDDGAAGLLSLRRAGATTVAQEPSTCVVDGMPGQAIKLGAAARVLKLEDLAAAMREHAR